MQTTTPSLPATASELLGPDDIVRELPQLPSAPKVLPRMLEILRDDRASMEDVVTLIKIDPGMASRVLQIANSAYYTSSAASRCPTMEEAVYRVGLVKVYELVAFAATAQLLMRTLRTYDLSPEEIWRRAVSCALAAERLAARVDADFNSAYTAGLLHGIGQVAIDTWASAAGIAPRFTCAGLPDETIESERRLLGFGNAAVAGALLRYWGFPAPIVEPVRWQHAPTSAGHHRRMAALLHCAKWIREAAHVDIGKPLPPLPHPSILALVPCDGKLLDSLLDEVREAFLKASLLLEEHPAQRD